MDYRGPIAGSPLIPPLAIGLGFVLGLAVFGSLYFYQRYRHPWFRRVVATLVIALAAIALAAAFWFLPTPGLATAKLSPQPLSGPITVQFDRPVSRRLLEKSISPDVPGMWVFEQPLYSTHVYRQVSFFPSESLWPDTEYTLQFQGIRSLVTKATAAAELRFKTVAPPEVASIETPSGTSDSVLVYLSAAADQFSEFEFEFSPTTPIEITKLADWSGYRLRFSAPLRPDQEYLLIVRRTNVGWNLDENRVAQRGDTVEVARTTFRSTPALAAAIARNYPVVPFAVSPQDGWTGVSLNAPLKISFDRPVNRQSAQDRLQVVPSTIGSFRWEGHTMIFQPAQPWRASADYQYTLAAGVEPAEGLSSDLNLRVKFRTQDASLRLKVPAYLQQHTLSCEVAALRMALAFYGVKVSEEELLAKVGVDDTPHQGDVWGNPHERFVGNVDGKQMVDGYGVYWGPIARVAGDYRPSEAFSGWTIQQLTGELQAGHPVVVWVYVRGGVPATWRTPDGQEIFAIRDEHSVTIVGFAGPADNPTEIIVNDPLIGQTTWPRALFDKKWAAFGNSGVAVR
jgi:uncharacterized protein YvpB